MNIICWDVDINLFFHFGPLLRPRFSQAKETNVCMRFQGWLPKNDLYGAHPRAFLMWLSRCPRGPVNILVGGTHVGPLLGGKAHLAEKAVVFKTHGGAGFVYGY